MPDDTNRDSAPVYTLAEGVPMANATTAQRFGDDTPIKGLMLLQDTQLIETLAHFSRERIPERSVHAGAVGAWGELEVTHDCSAFTDASFLTGIGKKSKVLWRLSITGPERGHFETMRDVRGWGMKIFTDEGNHDIVGNSIPTFFIRDPIKFPSMNRSHKPSPAKHVASANMFWDFHTANQEGIHALMMLFSDRGIPNSPRELNGYGGHTYKFTKGDGSFVYAKIHFKTDQGARGMKRDRATMLAGVNPKYHTCDLWDNIEKGNYPSWTMCAQIMRPEDAEKYKWNIFDMTKVWPHRDYPLIPMAKLTLNRNPENYFSDIEQAAFSPSNMVRGVAPTLDPMLQARMFAYPDAARYRLGANYQQLPCNRAVSAVYCPYERDGAMRYETNYGDDPNYVRSQLKQVRFEGELGKPGYSTGHWDKELSGMVKAYTSDVNDDDFEQARMMWDVLKKTGQDEDFVGNVVDRSLGEALPKLQQKAVEMFTRVDPNLGESIFKALKEYKPVGDALDR